MGQIIKVSEARETGLAVPDDRVVRYGLDELVYKLYLMGHSHPSIANKCNEALVKDRPEDGKFVEISAYLVGAYIKAKQKELDTNIAPDITIQQRVLPDVGEKLNQMVMMLETELEKVRNDVGPVNNSREHFFLEMLKEMRELLQLSANIQGKIGPSVQVAVFTNNVKKFADGIDLIPSVEISPAIKGKILDLMAETLVTPDLLVKKVEAKDGG